MRSLRVGAFSSLLLLLCPGQASAKDYFVAANGSDSADGLTEATAWQSLAAVQAAQTKLLPGDAVLFRRGDTFAGSLTVSKSGADGSPIRYGAFGSGARPRISGFSKLSGFKQAGNLHTVTLPPSVNYVNTVLVGGVARPLGRFPALDAAGGWLGIESVTAPSASKVMTITDAELPPGKSFVGGEVAVRRERSVLERWRITAQSGTTLTIEPTDDAGTYPPAAKNGYFIQSHPDTLKADGEWAFDTKTRVLTIYHAGALPEVEVSAVEDLFTLNLPNKIVSHLLIEELAFEGATRRAIFGNNVTDVTIRQSEFRHDGRHAVWMSGSLQVVFENNTVEDCPSSGVYFRYLDPNHVGGLRIAKNTFARIGTVSGMGASAPGSYEGVAATMHNTTIEDNVIQDTGYNAITFMGGDGLRIQHNVIERFCSVKDDGGGVYTWNGSTTKIPVWSDRIIRENIIRDGVGAPAPNSTNLFVSGVYLDLDSNNIEIQNNVIYGLSRGGITMNNPLAVGIHGNLIYDAENAIRLTRYTAAGLGGQLAQEIAQLDIRNNTVYPKQIDQLILAYTDLDKEAPSPAAQEAVLKSVGAIDDNTYGGQNPLPVVIAQYPVGSSTLEERLLSIKSLSQYGFDQKSVELPPLPRYSVDSPLGQNLFPNGGFDTTITGTGGNKTYIKWDGTGKLTGAGSLVVEPPDANPKSAELVIGNLGAIKAGARYLFRFTTLGNKADSAATAFIRKTAASYDTITNTERVVFGSAPRDHEVLLTATQDQPSGSFVVRLPHSLGTVYLDNMAVYEVSATEFTPDTFLRLEVNDSAVAKAVTLDDTYQDTTGQVLCGSLPLAPWQGSLLTLSEEPCTPGAGGSAGAGGSGVSGGSGQSGQSGSGGAGGSGQGGAGGSGGSGQSGQGGSSAGAGGSPAGAGGTDAGAVGTDAGAGGSDAGAGGSDAGAGGSDAGAGGSDAGAGGSDAGAGGSDAGAGGSSAGAGGAAGGSGQAGAGGGVAAGSSGSSGSGGSGGAAAGAAGAGSGASGQSGASGVAGKAGAGGQGSAGASGKAGSAGKGGQAAGGQGGAGASGEAPGASGDDGGCAYRAPGGGGSGRGAALCLLGLGVVAARRRRARGLPPGVEARGQAR